MKTDKLFLLTIGLISVIISSACGSSQAQLDATATQVAANIFATRTAEAPTVTPTPIPTATPTTPPTATPAPTATPVPPTTPTPTPGLESVIVTMDDLPEGFELAPVDEIDDLESSWPEGSVGFGYTDESESHMIMGVVIPYADRSDQAMFDAMLPEIDDALVKMLSGSTDVKDLGGLDKIGNFHTGATTVGKMLNLTMRFDVVSFRRESVGALLITAYPDGDKLTVTTLDLASLLDGRIKNYMVAEKAASSATIPKGSSPTAVVQAFLDLLTKPKAEWDSEAMSRLVCLDSKAKDEILVAPGIVLMVKAAASFLDEDIVGFHFRDLQLKELSNDGQVAVLRVTGSAGAQTVSGPTNAAYTPLTGDIRLVRENGEWKMCSNIFGK